MITTSLARTVRLDSRARAAQSRPREPRGKAEPPRPSASSGGLSGILGVLAGAASGTADAPIDAATRKRIAGLLVARNLPFVGNAADRRLAEELRKVGISWGITGPEHLAALARFAARSADPAHNVYEFKDDVKLATGRYHTDCSGFVTAMLDALRPGLGNDLIAIGNILGFKFGKDATDLQAADFNDLFSSMPSLGSETRFDPFGRVTHGAEIKAGDIIATEKFEADKPSTGHVMIAVAPPAVFTDAKGNKIYQVSVIDSSNGGTPNVKPRTVTLFAGSSGKVTGYAPGKYEPGDTPRAAIREVAIGRLNDRYKKGTFFAHPLHFMQALGRASVHRQEEGRAESARLAREVTRLAREAAERIRKLVGR